MKQSIRDLSRDEFERIETLYSKHENKLKIYAELLLWWNKKINLVSRDVSRETIDNHIKHSLYISLSEAFLEGQYFLDTGAGGGLPGLPLSICFPEKEFVINDIVAKKIFAVNDMINKLGLSKNTRGKVGDVGKEEIDKEMIVLTKHAFKVDQLYKLIEDQEWKKIIFLKGHKEASLEFEEVKENNSIVTIRLDAKFMDPFYNGKGLVELTRGGDE